MGAEGDLNIQMYFLPCTSRFFFKRYQVLLPLYSMGPSLCFQKIYLLRHPGLPLRKQP